MTASLRILQKDRLLSLALAVFALFGLVNSANAGANDFFGTNSGGGSQSKGQSTNPLDDDSNSNAVLPGLNSTVPNTPTTGAGPNDFTGDEKRMQRKYKANVASAKRLIDRGEQMMKDARNDERNKEFKKGKILKEIGEKALNDLKASNPNMEHIDEKPVAVGSTK